MKKKTFFILISFFVLMSFFIIKEITINSMSLSSNIISINDKEQIMNERVEYDGKIDLYYKGEKIPYILTDNYYLLSTINNDFYSNIINVDKFKLNLVSISSSSFSIIAYNDKYYKMLDVVITNLPVLSIDDDNDKINDIYTNMVLFEPRKKDTSVESYDIKYRLKGGVGLLFDKKSFRINVLDDSNNKRNVSLLGMDYDDDWVLNSLYLDKSFVREKIGYDIWNELSDDYQHQMEYIELVIDNDYRGIYCLQEVVDLNTFDASETDMLISIKKWNNEVLEPTLFNEDYDLSSSLIDEFEIEKGISDNELRIELLRSFRNSLNELSSNIDIKYDFDNSANYSLLVNLILASDNTYKNQKILFRDDNNYYTVIKSPWDLDWTFNNEIINTVFYLDEWYTDTGIPKSMAESEEFYNLMKEKYIKMRKNIYNKEYINSLIDKYESILYQFGAVERNNKRWRKSLSSSTVIRNFIDERILFLDNYFGVIDDEL